MLKKLAISVKLLTLACVLLVASSLSAAVNLVVNGGFETGDLTGWTLTAGDSNYTGIISGAGNIHTGNYSVFFSSSSSTLTQSIDLATTPGQTYEISFWLLSTGIFQNQFDAKFAGTTLLHQVNVPFSSSFTNHVFQLNATGSSSKLEFDFLNNANLGGVFLLDDVSVTAVAQEAPSEAPESASIVIWSLLAAICAIVALAQSLQRRQRA